MVPIILASDKTHLTVGTGNKEMHPLLLSIANIHAGVRMKASSSAFVLTAYLPIPKFLDVPLPIQSLLSARVYHYCIKMVTRGLHAAGSADGVPIPMSDPTGCIRRAHTPLVSHIADLPEQRIIAGVLSNQSPTSTATHSEFGNDQSTTPHPRRTRVHTLANVTRVSASTPVDDLLAYIKHSAEYGLIGVHQLFWECWGDADPADVLTPDALHSWHKFFFDHIRKWVINIIGGAELDRRMAALQPCVGVRHWPHGVSTLKQLTGREHRDLEKILVAVIAGAVTPEVLRTVRSITEFIFGAQGLLIHEEQRFALLLAMSEFHHYKDAVIKEGGRKGKNGSLLHFHIPKLEAMGAVVESIRRMGASYQHTSDITEKCHTLVCKQPYNESNRREYHGQMVRNLTRKEKIRFFNLYITMRTTGPNLVNIMVDEASALADHFPETTWLSQVLPADEVRSVSNCRSHPTNLFSKDKRYLSNDRSTAFTVALRPHHKLDVEDAVQIYSLTDLRAACGDFFSGQDYSARNGQRRSHAHCSLPFTAVHTWNNFRMQQASTQDARVLLPPRTVQALQPSMPLMPYGRCNTVIVDDPSGTLTSSDSERESSLFI